MRDESRGTPTMLRRHQGEQRPADLLRQRNDELRYEYVGVQKVVRRDLEYLHVGHVMAAPPSRLIMRAGAFALFDGRPARLVHLRLAVRDESAEPVQADASLRGRNVFFAPRPRFGSGQYLPECHARPPLEVGYVWRSMRSSRINVAPTVRLRFIQLNPRR